MEQRASSLSPELLIPANDLAAGNYQTNLFVLNPSDHSLLLQKTGSFVRAPEMSGPWVGFAQRFENLVVAPFTQAHFQDGFVHTWGRRYDVSANKILPTQMYSQSAALFQSSPKINFQLEGQASQDLMNAMTVTAPHENIRSVSWTGSREIAGTHPVTLSSHTEIQEDGLVIFSLNIQGQGAALNQLEMELPLNSQVMQLIHTYSNYNPSNTNGKITGPKSGSLISPLIWLGNEREGLQWITNQITNWNLSNFNVAYEVLPSTSAGNPLTFKVHMVNQRLAIPASGLKYEFALQATPVHAMPVGWRRWDMSVNANYLTPVPASGYWNAFDPSWNGNAANPNGIFCGFEATDRTLTQHNFENARGHIQPFMYWDMVGMWKGDPILANYSEDFGIPYDSHSSECAQNVDLWSKPIARNYAVYQLLDNLRQISSLRDVTPGFYLDVAQPAWQIKPGVTPGVEYDWKNRRELQRSFYAALKNEFPNKVIINHQSSTNLMAQLAYTDMMVTGEYTDMDMLQTERNYYHVYDLNWFRAEFAPQKWGVPTFFLPQIGRSLGITGRPGDPVALWLDTSPDSLKASEHILGMVFLHDLMNYAAYVQQDPPRWIANIKNNFGWDDAVEFIGYWDVASQSLITMPGAPQDVVVSVFRRAADHKLLLVFFNNTDADVTVNSTLNLAQLLPGMSRFRVSDPYLTLKLASTQWVNQVSAQLRANQSPTLDSTGHLSSLIIPQRNFRILNVQGE